MFGIGNKTTALKIMAVRWQHSYKLGPGAADLSSSEEGSGKSSAEPQIVSRLFPQVSIQRVGLGDDDQYPL